MCRYVAVAALLVVGLFVGVAGAEAQSALLNLPDASQHARITAVKEMKLAATAAPESLKAQHVDLVRRLENREDINK